MVDLMDAGLPEPRNLEEEDPDYNIKWLLK